MATVNVWNQLPFGVNLTRLDQLKQKLPNSIISMERTMESEKQFDHDSEIVYVDNSRVLSIVVDLS